MTRVAAASASVLLLALAACGDKTPSPPEVLIPAGEFIMGCRVDHGCDGRNDPRRPYLPAYFIDRRVVEVREHRACLGAGACTEHPASQKDRQFAMVTQDAAATYCRWLGKRLPSPEEWEKAARGIKGDPYPWGDKTDRCIAGDCRGVRSPFGLENVAGVRQWVDYRAEGNYPRGMAVGNSPFPYTRETTSKWTEFPSNRWQYFEVAAFRCARDADSPAPAPTHGDVDRGNR